MAGGCAHVLPRIISEKRLSVPTSMAPVSATLSVQVPLASCPLKADNGLSGLKLPVAAPATEIVDAAGNPPSSSSVMVQKFDPPPPRLAIRLTVVPVGEVSLNIRSDTKVCVTDAFRLPPVLSHAPAPASSRKFKSDMAPATPLTVSGILTPAVTASGMSTGGVV